MLNRVCQHSGETSLGHFVASDIVSHLHDCSRFQLQVDALPSRLLNFAKKLSFKSSEFMHNIIA